MSDKRNPVDVLKSLHDAGFVTDDALKKLDVPPIDELEKRLDELTAPGTGRNTQQNNRTRRTFPQEGRGAVDMNNWIKLTDDHGDVHVNLDNVCYMRRDNNDRYTILQLVGKDQVGVKETPDQIRIFMAKTT